MRKTFAVCVVLILAFGICSQTANAKPKKHPGYSVLEDALRVLPVEYAEIKELAKAGQFVFVDDIDRHFPNESAETRTEMKTKAIFSLDLRPPVYIYVRSQFFSQLRAAREQLLATSIDSPDFGRASKMVSVNSYLFVAKLVHEYLHGWRRFGEVDALKAEIAVIESFQTRGVFAKLGARIGDYLADLRGDLAEEQAKEQRVVAVMRQ